ncbi:IS5 family transposase [Cereibacter sphaeroides]|uniref:IS5 family transposase n=1 Tax=Cereibacter sphaeroides TaxID=1063 RepID=UPI001F3CED4D|nr:IS5 family transposase [Cereibacter sphaeroides]MCE6949721.1 IS5 family transposase [Cereibacter sphaeroides]MCE6957712.1 IS5 family transposase [Cereibacter sphaeroides]MCE6967262.1 IS5 family transposase [Cereibacter sphaeroides]MCE6971477.1 IS5 family transposase [Cereibacter sphaeroides]
MSNHFRLTDAQMERLKPFFPGSHGKPPSTTGVFCAASSSSTAMACGGATHPGKYSRAKILYSRWKRWSDNGIFARIMMGLAAEQAEHKTIVIDATCLKALRTAPSLRVRGRGRQIGRTKGGMNTKLHAVADAKGRPIGFFMSAGQVSDYTGAAALLGSLPKADWLPADLGYDADWLREALKDKGMKVCIPGRKSRKKAVRL